MEWLDEMVKEAKDTPLPDGSRWVFGISDESPDGLPWIDSGSGSTHPECLEHVEIDAGKCWINWAKGVSDESRTD